MRQNPNLYLIVCVAFGMASLLCLAESAQSKVRQGSELKCNLKGHVLDNHAPVRGAKVRIQATPVETLTDENGLFFFPAVPCDFPTRITAWAPGYYIAGGTAFYPGEDAVTIQLKPHTVKDHIDYQFLPSMYQAGYDENQGCAECHKSRSGKKAHSLPVDQWLQDAHSRTAGNPRFLSLYFGTDLAGKQSPPTRYIQNREYGRVPLPPNKTKPYFGPGYKLDFPNSDGNCGACHIPLAALQKPYGVNPKKINRLESEGVSCDFCHKIWDIRLDQTSGLPFQNMPGVLSLVFRRPAGTHQLFMGPLDDVAPGEDTFLPFQKQGQFCAACHFGTFWNTVIYNSYGEWLASTYSNPSTGKTCQDCHMPKGQTDYFALKDKGGLKRNASTIASHLMPGSMDKNLLQNSVKLNVDVSRKADQIVVTITILNNKTGHHVPTGSPLRHMILLVQAFDGNGKYLKLKQGPLLPIWTGSGSINSGNYAGLPGKAFAKILQEQWTNISPTAAYWTPTRILSDNRIPAFKSDTSQYIFSTKSNGTYSIEATLIYRRAYKELAQQKSWQAADIIMEHVKLKTEK